MLKYTVSDFFVLSVICILEQNYFNFEKRCNIIKVRANKTKKRPFFLKKVSLDICHTAQRKKPAP